MRYARSLALRVRSTVRYKGFVLNGIKLENWVSYRKGGRGIPIGYPVSKLNTPRSIRDAKTLFESIPLSYFGTKLAEAFSEIKIMYA